MLNSEERREGDRKDSTCKKHHKETKNKGKKEEEKKRKQRNRGKREKEKVGENQKKETILHYDYNVCYIWQKLQTSTQQFGKGLEYVSFLPQMLSSNKKKGKCAGSSSSSPRKSRHNCHFNYCYLLSACCCLGKTENNGPSSSSCQTLGY